MENDIPTFIIARRAIMDDLTRRYKEGDKGVRPNEEWHSDYGDDERKPAHYFTGSGEMPCPICKTGTLRYSRSSYNGHIHAACTKDDCVGWME